MTLKTDRKFEPIRQRVNELLHGSAGQVTLSVSEDGFYEQDDWLYLIVVPDDGTEKMSALDYVDLLIEIENQVRKEFHDEHILLVPARPD